MNCQAWSRSKVYLKYLRDLDLEHVAIIAMSPPTTQKTFLHYLQMLKKFQYFQCQYLLFLRSYHNLVALQTYF